MAFRKEDDDNYCLDAHSLVSPCLINFSHTYLDGLALPLGMKEWDGRRGTLLSALPELLTNVPTIRQVSPKAEPIGQLL
jgi:hypothetical protein